MIRQLLDLQSKYEEQRMNYKKHYKRLVRNIQEDLEKQEALWDEKEKNFNQNAEEVKPKRGRPKK